MRKELRPLAEKYREDMKAVVRHGGYKSVPRAQHYIETHLGEMWRSILRIDADDDPLCVQLNLTPTMALVLHLFGKAVHRHGAARSKLPALNHYLPVFHTESGKVSFPHAIPKNDIARMVGKSRSSVDDAVSRLRGKTERYAQLFDRRIAHPLFVETGIMLDMMTHPNLSFQFMYEDYQYASRIATDAHLNDAETVHKQKVWSREGCDGCENDGATRRLSEAMLDGDAVDAQPLETHTETTAADDAVQPRI